MFPKHERLRQSKLFEQIFRKGTWIRGRTFSLVVLPVHQKGKIGFIVTKKVAKSAVIRNAAKRRIRSAFLRALSSAPLRSVLAHNHIIVVIHRLERHLSFPALEQEVTYLLRKTQEKQHLVEKSP